MTPGSEPLHLKGIYSHGPVEPVQRGLRGPVFGSPARNGGAGDARGQTPERGVGRLLPQRFGALFGHRSEVNRRQKGTDQHHQQIDFHVSLSAAPLSQQRFALQSAFQSKQ